MLVTFKIISLKIKLLNKAIKKNVAFIDLFLNTKNVVFQREIIGAKLFNLLKNKGFYVNWQIIFILTCFFIKLLLVYTISL